MTAPDPKVEMPWMPDATRRVPLFLGILLALVIGLGFVVPPLYRAHKVRRAHQAISEMEAALAADDLRTAALRVRLALALAPTESLVQRGAAIYCTRAGSAAAMQYWQMLLDSGKATRADRIEYARALVRFDRPEIARHILADLLDEKKEDLECLELSLRALLLERRLRDALRMARMITELFPENDRGLLGLAELLLAQPEPTLKKQGQEILWGLCLRESPMRLSALGLLVAQTDLTFGELILIKRQLAAANDPTSRLLGLDVETRLRPDVPKSEILQIALGTLTPDAPFGNRVLLSNWLLERKFYEPVLTILPEGSHRTNTVALQCRLQSLAGLDRWQEIAEHVEDKSLPLSPVLRDVYRAIVASRTDSPEAVAGHLSNAAKECGSEPGLARLVASYAEAFDQPKIAAEALQVLMSSPSQVSRVAPELMRVLAGVDDTQPVLQALDRLLQFSPNDPHLANERAWWHLVTGQRIGASRAVAAGLVEKRPENLRWIATLALSHLRDNNATKALELIEPAMLKTTNAPLRAQLVYCASLGASGERESARRVARGIQVARLRSVERALIADWLKEPETQ